jgi:acetolactate synthase-1/2/3 large subunit
MNNRGGSIGYGLPAAVGAAVADPSAKVVALIGDGSAMYTIQALWTMARDQMDVTVLIFANRTYKILWGELANVGAGNPGPRARDMLDIDRPALDFVGLARAMGVEAVQVDDTEALARAFEDALADDGPRLIEILM